MIGWEQFAYAFICGAMLMMSLLGMHSASVTPSLERWDRRFFGLFFGALAIASAAFFLELAAYFNPELRVLQEVAYFVQTLCAMIPFPMLAVYLLRSCGEDYRRGPLVRAEAGLLAALLVILVVSPFTTVFYDVTPDGEMVRGPAYPLVLAMLLAMMLPVLITAVRRRGRLSQQRFRAFVVCLAPVMAALFIHFFADVFVLLDVALTVSAYAAYSIIVSEAAERDLRQQREIARQRTSIAVLQMRPHFIYNTMMSIYYLCDQDPKTAQRVTLDFTTYLRKNLAAIFSEGAIPFADEFEHTRAYLAVEQAQFEDALVVEFDTPHTRFRMPPLTLQPLVENAVKHGMDPDVGPLHVRVRTAETASGSEVVVEDDGPGFDPAVADDPHTTLANIRQRLDMMCGGTLAIEPRESGGTVVKLTVPHRE